VASRRYTNLIYWIQCWHSKMLWDCVHSPILSSLGTLKHHMTLREGVCSNRQSTVYFALFTVYVGEGGWLKMSYGGRGWLKTTEYHHIGGLKLLKNRQMIFERSLITSQACHFYQFKTSISMLISLSVSEVRWVMLVVIQLNQVLT